MKDYLVVKHNTLIQARYNLSLNEQKLLLYATSKIDRDKDDFTVILLDVKEFTELIDTKGNRYDEIKKMIKKLKSKEIYIRSPEFGDFYSSWLTNFSINKNTGKIRIRFDKDLMPFLLQLKKHFTRYKLGNVIYFKNKHSIRIYELLKQYEAIGKREFEIEELKNILMLEDQYPRFYDFEKNVLKPSMEEINEHTDIEVSYEKVTKGRKVVSLSYSILSKHNEDSLYISYLKENYNIDELKEKMGIVSENFNAKQVMELYDAASIKLQNNEDIDIFEYIKLNYEEMLKKKAVAHKHPYLLASIEEDYAKAAIILKVNKQGQAI